MKVLTTPAFRGSRDGEDALLSGPNATGFGVAAKATRIVSARAAVASGDAAGKGDGLGGGLSPQAARTMAAVQQATRTGGNRLANGATHEPPRLVRSRLIGE